MPDPLTLQQRHLCMSHIRSKDTSPEMKLRRELWRRGYRYRTNVRKLPGTPDIVLGRYRSVIFVPQPGARPAQQPAARVNRLERHHGVGMRARESSAQRYCQPHRDRAGGEQGKMGGLQPAPQAGPPVRRRAGPQAPRNRRPGRGRTLGTAGHPGQIRKNTPERRIIPPAAGRQNHSRPAPYRALRV